MTKIDRYIKVNRRNKIYSVTRTTSVILMIVILIPFMITAFDLFSANNGDQDFHVWSMLFWTVCWINLISSRGHDKTSKKLNEMRLSEEEIQQMERQKKLDKLL